MKKLIFLLLLLLIATPCFGQVMMQGVVGGGVAAGGANGLIGGTTNADSIECLTTKIVYSDYVTTTAGTISYAHILVLTASGDETVCITIWDSSGTAIKSTAPTGLGAISSATWINVALSSSTTILAATTYWLGLQVTGSSITMVAGAFATGIPDTYGVTHVYNCGDNVSGATLVSSRPLAIIFNNQAGNPS